MNIAIADDDLDYRQSLSALVDSACREFGIQAQIDTYCSGEDFLASLNTKQYTLVFLDIYMDTLNGISTARALREVSGSALIVFCTSSTDFMGAAFSCHAFDYLTKPATAERVRQLMKDVLAILPQTQRYVTVTSDGRDISILYSDLSSVTTDGHYIVIYTLNGVSHRVRMTLSDFQKMLGQDKRFLLINRGILVNMDMISSFQRGVCRMADGQTLPVKVRGSAQIEQAWHTYSFEKIRQDQTDLKIGH